MPTEAPAGTNTGTTAPTGANIVPSADLTKSMMGNNTTETPPSTATPPSPADDADASKQENTVLGAQTAAANAQAAVTNAREAMKDVVNAEAQRIAQEAAAKEYHARFNGNMTFPAFHLAWYDARNRVVARDSLANLAAARVAHAKAQSEAATDETEKGAWKSEMEHANAEFRVASLLRDIAANEQKQIESLPKF